jgi:UDPglucose--hexose-1-phosphate uridylyltransferase
MPEQASRAFHWRLEIVPRLTTASGFELGSGVYIVAVAPEDAARRLRAALKG